MLSRIVVIVSLIAMMIGMLLLVNGTPVAGVDY